MPTKNERTMPCGCVVCVCGDVEQCSGCGSSGTYRCNESRRTGGPLHVLPDGSDAHHANMAFLRRYRAEFYPDDVKAARSPPEIMSSPVTYGVILLLADLVGRRYGAAAGLLLYFLCAFYGSKALGWLALRLERRRSAVGR